MMPECSHTGTPRHFHASTTSASACLMRLRTRASVSPRQSPSSLILASISREGEVLSFAFVAALLLCFMAVVGFFFYLFLARREWGGFATNSARRGRTPSPGRRREKRSV